MIVVTAVALLSCPVFICFSGLDVLDDGNAEYNQMMYRALQIENEVRRGDVLNRMSNKEIVSMLDADERIHIEDKVTSETGIYKSNRSPEEVGEIQKKFTAIVIRWLEHHYSHEIEDLKDGLKVYVDPNTHYTYAVYTHTFQMDKSHHEVEVIITRNVSSVVTEPLQNFLLTVQLVLPWYIITVSLFTYTVVSRVFRKLGRGIDKSLADIEENNYKGRLEITERNSREISAIKKKINLVLDRMDNLVTANIESLQDVSHEVNTHLTAIKQSVDVMKIYGERNPQLAISKLHAIDENIKHATSIMTAILELARLDQEVSCTPTEAHDVKELIESFVTHYRKVFPDFHFFTYYNCENPKVYINREHFYIAVKPIIENAAKYSSNSRYISISVKGEYSPTSPLYVSIKNRGIGIKKEDMPFIFNRNYRGDTGGKKGSGIGLAITKKVMDLYGSTINVYSMPGQETIFTLVFSQKKQAVEDAGA